MASSFWSNSLLTDEMDSETIEKTLEQDTEKTERVAIKHSVPTEETHELAVDVYETDERVYVVAPLAGVKSTDLEISVNEDQVLVKGLRKNPFEEHADKLYSSECFWGKFERRLTLPKSVDTRDISATFRNGILLIESPRITPTGSRKVKIN